MARESRHIHAFARSIAVALASCSAEPVADVGAFTASATEGDSGDDDAAPSTGAGTSDGGPNPTTTGDDPDSGPADTEPDDDGPILDVGSDATPSGCANDTDAYIWLITTDGALYRWSPSTDAVESLGTPVCEGAGITNGLTMDRSGLLWTQRLDMGGYRRIYTLDPMTLECIDTGYADPDGYSSGGIAFVADAPGSEQETLWVGMVTALSPEVGLTVAKVDVDTMVADIVGELPPAETSYQLPDMTGTGEGRLFAFFAGGPIAEIDTGGPAFALQQQLPFAVGSPWAFGQWGARLYLFSPGDVPQSSRVRAWDPITEEVEDINVDLGIPVVGAAVSTCAPYEPEG